MTYRELIQAAKFSEPLEHVPTWFQEQVMAFARGWRASPVHYCIAVLVGAALLGIGLVHLSVPSKIRVDTTPDEARVMLDGKDVGVTPIVLKDLARGDHKIEITKSGYEIFPAYFTVSAGAPSSYRFVLRRVAEAPLPVATSDALSRTPSLALAETTPTASVADAFRSPGHASGHGSRRHRSRSHRRR